MQTVFKYPISPANEQIIKVKGLKRILGVQTQHDDFGEKVVLYVLVDTDIHQPIHDIFIVVLGTGHPADTIDDSYRFLGTVSLAESQLMFHIFAMEVNHVNDDGRKEIDR
jgi:hypothetical protein